MEKLNVDTLFSGETEYDAAKNKYIAEYTEYVPGGVFSVGHYESRPDTATAKWKASYPNGFTDWRERAFCITYSDLKAIEKKINEIIDSLTPPADTTN
jgi:hypothetical protein